MNGMFVCLAEYASEIASGSPLLNKFDKFFYGYRIFLITYIIFKFAILIGETVLS